jgi:hypothetical protein
MNLDMLKKVTSIDKMNTFFYRYSPSTSLIQDRSRIYQFLSKCPYLIITYDLPNDTKEEVFLRRRIIISINIY